MRRSLLLSLRFVFSLTLLVTTTAIAQISDSPGSVNCPPTVTLAITVTTEQGALIPDALVILREDTLGQPRGVKVFTSELRTDGTGKATVAVPCNYLDVLVAKDGFAPAAQKFLVALEAHAFSVSLKMYPVTRTTEVLVPRVQPSDMPPLPDAIPESPPSRAQDDPTFYIGKPTILAFFEPVHQGTATGDAAGSNEALADFQFYGRQVLKPLAKMGVDYKEVHASGFEVKIGDTSTNFRATRGVGYYLVAPGKQPRVEYGVMTDRDLLQTAHNYFGVNDNKQ